MMLSFKQTLTLLAAAGVWALPAQAQNPEDWPWKPLELVCTTSPGSSLAVWCQLFAEELPEIVGQPVKLTFMSGGAQHEPMLYVDSQPADGHVFPHVSASFYGYWHLPHYTVSYEDDFQMLTRVETHVNGIAILCDNPYGITSWQDYVAYAKEHPGELAQGSNKVGSNHHRHQTALFADAGMDVRFVPYDGDGDTVKDVVGGHIPVGMGSPRTWRPHIQAGTVCPLLIMNEERLTQDQDWKDVPGTREVGLDYEIVHQWQGHMVKNGTPPEIMDKLADALEAVTETEAYKGYLEGNTHIIPTFNKDREWLHQDMIKNMEPTKQFMIEHKIIPAS
jgi:tripartite-type tricarboxylate transporter receptor subunit TctC